MSIPATFEYQKAEERWYQYWLDQKLFESKPDERTPYTIVIPPPNVTGVLHMGHMLNNTLQDVLIRRARMKGFNACWVPGTDHASIATEAKVVAKLKEEGIAKADLSREEFLKHAWAWTEKHGGIILHQLKKLGASCDWSREAFTMDEARSESVIKVFVDLYNKGKIYRGYRMVNWDPEAKTTVSDEEVIHKEVNGKLYYLKYKQESGAGYLTVATTRPETIFGDVAVCVNPNDERYKHLLGTKVQVPVVNRWVPIIADEYVDIEFGTGCLKITPAHDINDKEIGERHQLEIIDSLDDAGKLNEHGMHYAGKDRFVVRKEIAKEITDKQLMEKVEDYKTSIGTSERTGAVIEPKLSQQWFLKMKELSKPALDAVMSDEVALIPEKFKNTYRHWMENVHDWSISRQLWWGHQIPAWYYGEGDQDFVVAETEEEALKLAQVKTKNTGLTGSDLHRDPDALDTWFSSWLWPIAVFDGIRYPENEEIKYYYPTQDLVTAPEILFFWVARMIIAGYEFRDEKPFSKVYLTGIVRDKQGRKMSKSLGNSPDPIGLMEKYSTDGVRVGMLLTSPAGNDLPFDEDLCVQGRNFSNKIWNALRLMQGWELDDSPADASAKAAIHWFTNKKQEALKSMEESFESYRLSEALMTLYKFVWDDFCSWYLEAVKPAYQQPLSREVHTATINFFEEICLMLHPFMPFLSEEIWHLIKTRTEGASICVAPYPVVETFDAAELAAFDQARSIINGVRNIRASNGLSPRLALSLYAKSPDAIPGQYKSLIAKLANLDQIEVQAEITEAGLSFLAGKHELVVPAGEAVNVEEEIEKLKKDLAYQEGFKVSISKKLGNERFVSNAPEAVVAAEQKKLSDAEAKIKALSDRIAQLS
jgi:valyl-tRNA synthetase